MMIQAPQNYILAEIEKKFQDKRGDLYIDTTWLPEEHVTLEGIVVSAPLGFKGDGHRKVVGAVKEGDRIIFSYAIIFEYDLQPDNDTPVYSNLVLYEGKEYWKVDIGEVFCKVNKDGSCEMVTGNVLLEPYYEKRNTIEDLILIEDKNEDMGVIKAISPAMNLSCNVGDVVCFEPRFVQKYNILGREHYIIPSRRVLAKV